MKLIFASHNENKVSEIQNLLGERFNLLSLKELSYYDDIRNIRNFGRRSEEHV